MRSLSVYAILLLLLSLSVASSFKQIGNALPPADPNATAETNHLLQRLYALAEKGVMFAHQDDLVYGYKWKYVDGGSDVKDIVGDYPGLVGFELADIELGKTQSLDGVDFDQIIKQMKVWNAKGGIATISIHFNNPITGKDAWDNSYKGADKRLVEGGDTHSEWTKRLDLLAEFLLKLKDDNGNLIPFIFRPFHEFTNGWSWWSTGTGNSNAEFIALYKSTIDYLRAKGCHHFLLAYNTDKVSTLQDYIGAYVGDDYIDLLTYDVYGTVAEIRTEGEFACSEAKKRGKLCALAEFGISDANGWSSVFEVLKSHPEMSYGLLWRDPYNQAPSFPGLQPSQYDDLRKIYADPNILFLEDVQLVK